MRTSLPPLFGDADLTALLAAELNGGAARPEPSGERLEPGRDGATDAAPGATSEPELASGRPSPDGWDDGDSSW